MRRTIRQNGVHSRNQDMTVDEPNVEPVGTSPGSKPTEAASSDPGVDSQAPLLSDRSKEPADREFLDDLAAANRFKSFLVGRGRPVTFGTSAGLGSLLTEFGTDLKEYENQVREGFFRRLKRKSFLSRRTEK
jgi:hypothetical protein